MVGKLSGEFLASEEDGFGIETGDARKVSDGGSVGLLGKRGDIPAALRFTHAAEQKVDLVMVASKLGLGASLAGSTCALMNNWFRLSCHLLSFPDEAELSISGFGTYSFMSP
jgi:hypothetical protein